MKTRTIIITLLLCCILAIVASVIASSHPDGLEWVAEKFGFLDMGEGKGIIKPPMPDYAVPGIKNTFLSSSLAAVIGTAGIFVITCLITNIIKSRRKN